MQLSDPLSVLPKTHSTTLKRLNRIGINTIEDLILYLPKRYVDYSVTSPIGQVQSGEIVTVSGTVTTAKTRYVRRNFSLQEVIINDGTGELKLIWFNQPYLIRNTPVGSRFSASGEIEKQGTKVVMKPKEYEIIPNSPASGTREFRIPSKQSLSGLSSSEHGTCNLARGSLLHTGRIVPIYSERGGLSSRLLREKIGYILRETKIEGIEEWLPKDIVSENHLTPYQEAVGVAHNPNTIEDAQKARNRFAFDELFTLHLANALVRKAWHAQSVRERYHSDPLIEKSLTTFVSSLPFTLTNSQVEAWDVIKSDLMGDHPMNRFLQGDVGSGKTVIAALASYFTHLNHHRTLVMCPTEILAQQHYATLSKLFENSGITIGLVTGSTKHNSSKCLVPSASDTTHKTSRQNVPKHQTLSTKYIDIIIGTHALLSDKHSFDNVGLVVIDEQHRFGVAQRAILKKKTESKPSSLTKGSTDDAGSPHLLTMTATPIPRTLALTIFGDLDVTVLSDMPQGRLPIKTYLAPKAKRQGAYAWIEKHINETGCQVFIVCPRITDDDDIEGEETKLSIKAVESEAEILQKEIFPKLRIGLLHGKMKSREKEEIMKKFKEKEFDILVTTTVVEVGIDIPNATIIVIEGAERYGLAQLHQLRGRVGRNTVQSYCVLFTTDGVNQSERLAFFAHTNNGMELAEYDFRHRGAGDIYGTAQHGEGGLEIANLFDSVLVSTTQKVASKVAEDYSATKYPLIATRLAKYATQPIAKD